MTKLTNRRQQFTSIRIGTVCVSKLIFVIMTWVALMSLQTTIHNDAIVAAVPVHASGDITSIEFRTERRKPLSNVSTMSQYSPYLCGLAEPNLKPCDAALIVDTCQDQISGFRESSLPIHRRDHCVRLKLSCSHHVSRDISTTLLNDAAVFFDGIQTMEPSSKENHGSQEVTVSSITRSLSQKRESVLIVVTTCNHLETTVVTLEYIRRAISHYNSGNRDEDQRLYPSSTDPRNVHNTRSQSLSLPPQELYIDLVVVDDHSSDGTVAYLRRRGYHVISKPGPRGLTHSWNIGYRLATSLGYHALILMNNDVLVPAHGTLGFLLRALRHIAIAVPLTSHAGFGQTPTQSVLQTHNVSIPLWEKYVNNPRHAQEVQDALTRKYLRAKEASYPLEPVTTARALGIRSPRFTGFFFAVNVSAISPAAYKHPELLFDPADIMINQEWFILRRMMYANPPIPRPLIAIHSFVFHFRSVTVSAALIRQRASEGADGQRGTYRSSSGLDNREDLQLFHPSNISSTSRTGQQNRLVSTLDSFVKINPRQGAQQAVKVIEQHFEGSSSSSSLGNKSMSLAPTSLLRDLDRPVVNIIIFTLANDSCAIKLAGWFAGNVSQELGFSFVDGEIPCKPRTSSIQSSVVEIVQISSLANLPVDYSRSCSHARRREIKIIAEGVSSVDIVIITSPGLPLAEVLQVLQPSSSATSTVLTVAWVSQLTYDAPTAADSTASKVTWGSLGWSGNYDLFLSSDLQLARQLTKEAPSLPIFCTLHCLHLNISYLLDNPKREASLIVRRSHEMKSVSVTMAMGAGHRQELDSIGIFNPQLTTPLLEQLQRIVMPFIDLEAFGIRQISTGTEFNDITRPKDIQSDKFQGYNADNIGVAARKHNRRHGSQTLLCVGVVTSQSDSVRRNAYDLIEELLRQHGQHIRKQQRKHFDSYLDLDIVVGDMSSSALLFRDMHSQFSRSERMRDSRGHLKQQGAQNSSASVYILKEPLSDMPEPNDGRSSSQEESGPVERIISMDRMLAYLVDRHRRHHFSDIPNNAISSSSKTCDWVSLWNLDSSKKHLPLSAAQPHIHPSATMLHIDRSWLHHISTFIHAKTAHVVGWELGTARPFRVNSNGSRFTNNGNGTDKGSHSDQHLKFKLQFSVPKDLKDKSLNGFLFRRSLFDNTSSVMLSGGFLTEDILHAEQRLVNRLLFKVKQHGVRFIKRPLITVTTQGMQH